MIFELVKQEYDRQCFPYRLEPSKNYQLFLKATQIDLITEKLDECLHLHKAHREELANTEKVSKFYEKAFANIKVVDYDN